MSISTQAMCCAGMQSLLEKHKLRSFLNHRSDPNLSERIANILHGLRATIFAQIAQNIAEQKPAWHSTTFGKQDIFTASWLVPVALKSGDCPQEVKNRIVDVLSVAAQSKDFDKPLFELKDNEAGPHPLPLLWTVIAVRQLLSDESNCIFKDAGCQPPPDSFFRDAGRWFERNLHRQMSFSRFDDFRFDAAELVFCLFGTLITNTLSNHDLTIPKVLDIIQDAQKRSVYWRPYRPMTSTGRGGVLLPLSIEVATALLETLTSTSSFHSHQQTLEKYYGWLVSQKVVANDLKTKDPCEAAGWHSENAYETKKIHVWDTARVAMFLCKYGSALETETRNQILDVSKFTRYDFSSLDADLDSIVPFDYGSSQNLVDKLKVIAQEPKTSILLSGPPGVAKTTMAMAIAKHRKCDLIYLTPSDFISGGVSAIEETTKTIFDALTALHDVVICFDEIDRMILDRDSTAYGKQDELFQFMTPGMLAKLATLRKEGRATFIIATNYAERIDPAIKRSGRIEENILCLPFNRAARVELLKRFLAKEANKRGMRIEANAFEDPKLQEILTGVANRTRLYVYEPLKKLVSKASARVESKANDGVSFLPSVVNELHNLPIPPPEIRLGSYSSRWGKDFPQQPFEEFLRLCLLYSEHNPQDVQTAKEFGAKAKDWDDSLHAEFADKRSVIIEEMKRYGLESWENYLP